MQTVKYQPIDENLTMENIFNSLPAKADMMAQIAVTYTLSSPTNNDLATLDALKVTK